MSNVTMFDKRPKCRVCGTKSHVTTVANPRSPMLGCCASCGVAARSLARWFDGRTDVELSRMLDVVLESSMEKQPENVRLSGAR